MAQSMFSEERVKQPKKTWRAVVVGAVVPIAMFAAAPAVSAAETDQAETVNSEQLPGVPLPVPLPVPGQPAGDGDDDLVTLLGECVAALVTTVVGAAGDAPLPAEQLPTDTLAPCLELLGALGLPVDLPVDLPLPKEQ